MLLIRFVDFSTWRGNTVLTANCPVVDVDSTPVF